MEESSVPFISLLSLQHVRLVSSTVIVFQHVHTFFYSSPGIRSSFALRFWSLGKEGRQSRRALTWPHVCSSLEPSFHDPKKPMSHRSHQYQTSSSENPCWGHNYQTCKWGNPRDDAHPSHHPSAASEGFWIEPHLFSESWETVTNDYC